MNRNIWFLSAEELTSILTNEEENGVLANEDIYVQISLAGGFQKEKEASQRKEEGIVIETRQKLT